MKYGLRWMDSDMHLAEPGDLWQRYIEAELRDRVPELTGVAPDYDVLSRSQIPAIEQIRKDRTHLLEEYLNPTAHCIDPDGQLRAMDREAIDAAILFPTAGRRTHGEVSPKAHIALNRAYNSWLHDFCAYEPFAVEGQRQRFHSRGRGRRGGGAPRRHRARRGQCFGGGHR